MIHRAFWGVMNFFVRLAGYGGSELVPRGTVDIFRKLMVETENEHPGWATRGNAPGHPHQKPGIWDMDNAPERRGQSCTWCANWWAAKKLLGD